MSSPPSTITLSSLKFIKPADLANSLTQPTTAPKVAVIDVRDSDHIGGHIKGSQWIPSDQLDLHMPELLRVNADKDRVVFHCMLSQQRGPKAALAYARAKQHEAEKRRREQKRKEKALGQDETMKDERDVEGADGDEVKPGSGKIAGQEICVLEGGFGNWQAFYGEDKALTEDYVQDLWL